MPPQDERRVPFSDFYRPLGGDSPLRQRISAAYRRPEPDCLAALAPEAEPPLALRPAIGDLARRLITALRRKGQPNGVSGLVKEYSLSSQEGVALMCLAEALLRIPDDATRDALIRDKIIGGDWRSHLGAGRSVFVNAATWGLVVAGTLVGANSEENLAAAVTRLVARFGEPIIRRSTDLAMEMMGEQFVTGETIEAALRRAEKLEARGFGYSYDMLGEAATTDRDAQAYLAAYERAIHAIGKASQGRGAYAGPGISIKLSALHPRYARAQAGRVMDELVPRVRDLARLARHYDIGFNIDAEEADRLELSLDILENLALDPDLAGWKGLGFVVQAYGKRCPFVIDWIIDLARRSERRLMVRLVKGAYWDSEIKRAQVDGLADFPVFTRKAHTDISYIACARRLLAARDVVFPQFATHNAQTVATIFHLAGPDFTFGDYEFQCLHGMGEPLYDEVVGEDGLGRPCRIYAPVGTHETLLAYLVRRLLENGANSSFVNRIWDETLSPEDLAADPVETARAFAPFGSPHPLVRLPGNLHEDRRNSLGLDLSDEQALGALETELRASASLSWRAEPLVPGLPSLRQSRPVVNPANHADQVGEAAFALERDVAFAAEVAAAAFAAWSQTPVEDRACILERAADALQAQRGALMGLLMREAGKTAANAAAEVREAIDFLRYYAAQARLSLPGCTAPLGPVVCISPWNFPLAIFIGQIAAALVCGDTVLAKPAEETPLIAAAAVKILHAAGVPQDALVLLPGDGAIGASLVANPRTAAVLFTGSTEVAKLIQRALARRVSAGGDPIPLIAETGGQNAMIVDSSALAEQVTADVLASAFDSAGQRCSALRILCLQEEIADRQIAMIKGALAELAVGETDRLCADIGPVISQEAKERIEAHIDRLAAQGLAVHRHGGGAVPASGTFVAPALIEIDSLDRIGQEVFGPVLHVIRYRRAGLDSLIDALQATGYGLTFGLHTRLDEVIDHVTRRVTAGNVYINRNVVGAVVGVQPFGGRGLSGTGPKAGGPLYLGRLVTGAPRLPLAAADAAPRGVQIFADWLAARGFGDLSLKVRALRALTGWGEELAGPVGEKNLYSLHPRGEAALIAHSPAGLYAQIAVALAQGNRLLIVQRPGLDDDLKGLPVEVSSCVAVVEHLDAAGSASAILIEPSPEGVTTILQAVAALEGPIPIVQRVGADGVHRPEWLVEEVSVSINTTAAGGNAGLMALV